MYPLEHYPDPTILADFGLVIIMTISPSTDELSEKMEAGGKLGSFLLTLFTRTDQNARNFH